MILHNQRVAHTEVYPEIQHVMAQEDVAEKVGAQSLHCIAVQVQSFQGLDTYIAG